MKFPAVNGPSEPEASVTVDSAAGPHLSPNVVAATTPLAFEKLAPEGETWEGGEYLDADVHSEADDDNATVSTRTEDDIVNMVMTAVLPSDDDEDDQGEQIVYPKQNISSPTA